jgi:hypothetical protein
MILELIKYTSLELYDVDFSRLNSLEDVKNYTLIDVPIKGKEWLKPILDFLLVLLEAGYDPETKKLSLPFWKWPKIIKALLKIFNS